MVLVQQGRNGETQGKGRLLSLFEYQPKEGKLSVVWLRLECLLKMLFLVIKTGYKRVI